MCLRTKNRVRGNTNDSWSRCGSSTIHCVAGDATGIILAAAATAILGLPMWVDLIVEYCAGFACGLFIFQSLFMKSMMGGSYKQNLARSFTPEFVSMNFMMAGMAPVMSLLMMGRDMRAMVPHELLFWGVMSFGVIAGFSTAYPVNVWMVARRLKHGLMTQREPHNRFDPMIDSGGSRSDRSAEQGVGNHGRSSHATGHDGASNVTRPQLIAVAGVSFTALALGDGRAR